MQIADFKDLAALQIGKFQPNNSIFLLGEPFYEVLKAIDFRAAHK